MKIKGKRNWGSGLIWFLLFFFPLFSFRERLRNEDEG